MSVLILAALLSSVTCSSADISASAWGRQHCVSGYCVTLNDGEVTVEAGLCVVIPCSYRTGDGFTPKHIAWYKCEVSEPRCGNPIMIFHTNNSIKVQSGFKARVSFLEPDLSQNNCSFFINKLKQSDSGSYHLRVIGELNGKPDGFSFSPRVTVYVKGFKLKPTVMIPTLTEGQQATLTCTAPGLCSGSVPQITWTWRGAGGTESYITGNSTDYKTENLTDVTQSPVSTLTFNPSAKHHNTNVTCKISFTGETITEETSTLNVNYLKEVKISGVTRVKEHESLNLTCSVESFPLSLIRWSRLSSDTNLQSDLRSATFIILNATTKHAGQYVCMAQYMNNTLKEKVTVRVMYYRKPQIAGRTVVKEGDVLNLTCGIESFPPALIVWKMLTSNINPYNGTNTDLYNDTGSATLVIQNVAAEHSGQYVCAAKHLDTVLTVNVSVTVTYKRKLQITGDTTVEEENVLNMTCSIESFPPALIVWKKMSTNTNLHSGTYLYNDTGSATLTIPNVTAQHSGQYICTAKHLNTTVTSYVSVTVTYSRQPLINGNTTVKEGDVLNLTCSVDSIPPALIVWKDPISNTNLHIGTYTDLYNDTGSATLVIQNVTAEDSGQYICSAKHLDTTLISYINVTVTYLRQPLIIGNTTVKEGDVLNLTCSVESIPPALIVWKKPISNTNLHIGTYTDLHNNTGSATLVIQNVTAEDSGQYICTAKHLDTTLTLYVDVTVTYKRRPLITGNTTLNEGDVLNLTCSVESIPSALIGWKKVSDNTNLQSGIHTNLHNDTGSATLFIPNVTAKDSGQYICAAKHLDTIVTVNVSVTVTWLSNIQNGSGCVLHSQILTCVCIIEGFPLPTIQWLPLKNNTEYSVITAVSNDTVNSTVSLNVEKHGNITLECVSNNGNEEAKEKFTIHNNSKKYEQPLDLSKGYLKVIVAFLIGTLLTAVVCFLAKKYYRKKQKSSGNLHETLEMDRRQDDPQVYDGSLLEENLTLILNSGPKEVEYADTNLSL
ncbi:immunoglobulin superfamily member 10-like [Pundamilia nyererei]|uniref:immunoglobulin superfamily member 10-like n=1 Tax=Pundamilia nyererei TaxID=303518 RepID=UPI0006AB3082|nr:PREDICTED: immunoglobulin superfamily member 10-like [Pundamilia nyererei]